MPGNRLGRITKTKHGNEPTFPRLLNDSNQYTPNAFLGESMGSAHCLGAWTHAQWGANRAGGGAPDAKLAKYKITLKSTEFLIQ